MKVRYGFVIPMSFFIVLCLYCSVSEAAHTSVRTLASSVLQIHSVSDWAIQTFFVTLGYQAIYILGAGLFEYTNPTPKTPQRIAEIKLELSMGVVAMICNVLYAMTWMWLVEPYGPFFGYFETHQYTVTSFLAGTIVYLFWFDSWFYWTHRLLHLRKPFNFWYHVHRHHHQFVDPTAFAQDAVHPFEAILQGPMGHYFITLLFPLHPVVHAVFGFLTSLYAIAAHDARSLDLNDHVKHHHYKSCNFALYWAFWDYVCLTRFCHMKYPEKVTSSTYLN